MTITELAIKRPTLVVVCFTFLGVLGIYGFSQLKYDLMPKMTAPIITISTAYPGGSPNEVETSVSKIIEDAVSGMENIVAIRTYSMEGFSMVMLELEQFADIDLSLQDAQRKVNSIATKLPDDALTSVVSKVSFDELPVLRMAIRSNLPSTELYQFIKDRIQPSISRIPGVGVVNYIGGEEREIQVNIDANKLKAYNLSLFAITQAIKAANLDFPTGRIKESDEQFVVRIAGKYSSIDEMRNVIVSKGRQGGEIKIKDIAEVQDGVREQTTINRLNGITSVGLQILKQSDANTVEVSEKIQKEIKKLEKDYAKQNLKFDIAQDASVFILDSANAVKVDLLLAICLVALVMLLFLHSFRNSFIVMVAIPSSLVSTFFIMFISGFTLNIMTLLAMSLVIGILVDDSIVVLENIHRWLEKGEKPIVAALMGRNEIGFAALSITLVDVVVFVPLALITGMIGNFLREYALVVVFSTLMSLFVSFTITPMLASRFSKIEHLSNTSVMGMFGRWFEKFFAGLTEHYLYVLKWSLGNGGKIGLLSTLLFFASISLAVFGFIGFEFIPQVDRGELIITTEIDPGSTVEFTNKMAQKTEKIIARFPEVEKILTSVGTTSEGLFSSNTNSNTEFYITLVNKNQRSRPTDLLGQEIKKKIAAMPGVKVRVSPVGLMGTSTRTPVQILVTGTSHEDVIKGANIIGDVVKQVQGTTDVRLSSEEGKPELRVEVDRDKMAFLGLSVFDVGQNLRIALTGDDDSKFRDGITDYDIRIQLDRFDRSDAEQVGNLTFMNNKGQQIELKQFANVYQTVGPTRLERENRIPSVNIYSQVLGKTSGVIMQEITAKLEGVKLPDGVQWEVAGEQKNMRDSMSSLLVALMAGILFVYMIMIALYDSYLYPFVVLFSIPMAILGALFGLALTAKSMSIYSMLGLIMLIGLVAKNAILLVDRTNQMKLEKGMSTYDALLEAGKTRLRPILMTTMAMIMGMLPIALSKSAGSEAKSGLGVVLIGGLFSSLVLTLVLIPVVYQRFDKTKRNLKARLKKN